MRRPWSVKEDSLLLKGIEEYISNENQKNVIPSLIDWKYVASKVVSRNAKQCKSRYCECLDPNLKKGPLSDKERMSIIKLRKEGRKLAEVARILSRPVHMVKYLLKSVEMDRLGKIWEMEGYARYRKSNYSNTMEECTINHQSVNLEPLSIPFQEPISDVNSTILLDFQPEDDCILFPELYFM